jgi:hypothetical protein
MLVAAFASARPDRLAWNDRKWEWTGPASGNADFEAKGGMDLEARAGWFAQAIGSSPTIFRRSAGPGSVTWMSARDTTGRMMDGTRTYRMTVPLPVPSDLTWSLTAYDAVTRSQLQAAQDNASLRSAFELKDIGDAKSVDLYFGPTAPSDQKAHWIQTIPGRGWFAHFRIDGPQTRAFDGSWKPGDFQATGPEPIAEHAEEEEDQPQSK